MNRRRAIAALCLAAGVVLSAAAAPRGASQSARPAAYRLELIGHAAPTSGTSADVWGHGSYAYLSSYAAPNCPALGVRVYDLRDPRRPKLVSTFADGGSEPALKGSDTEKTIVKTVRTAQFKGDLAVTGIQACKNDGFTGFGVYDVTNPARPKRLALVKTEPRGVHELWVQAARGRAYVYAAVPASELLSSPDFDDASRTAKTPGQPDFRIYDVSNPARPVEVGGWGAWRQLGISPRTGRGLGQASIDHSVITNAAATRAYLSYWDTGTVILDIRDPARPRYLGRTQFGPTQPEGDAHSAALAKGGRILVETHEAPRPAVPAIYDISTPARPRHLADVRLPGYVPAPEAGLLGGVHDPKVVGNRAYFSWYRQGVVVADISNPARPRVVAQYRPGSQPVVWGVYVLKNRILASDMNSGLWVLRLRRVG